MTETIRVSATAELPTPTRPRARGQGGLVEQWRMGLASRARQGGDVGREPNTLGKVLGVEWKRRCRRCIEDLDRIGQHFDFARREIRIDRALGPRADAACHRDAVFAAQLFCSCERRRTIGIADDLHDAFAIAQVNEDDAAVIATPVHPSHEGNGLSQVAAVDAAAIVGAFQIGLRRTLERFLQHSGADAGASPARDPRAISFGFRKASG